MSRMFRTLDFISTPQKLGVVVPQAYNPVLREVEAGESGQEFKVFPAASSEVKANLRYIRTLCQNDNDSW